MLLFCYFIYIFDQSIIKTKKMARPKNEDLDTILYLNPRINSDVKKDFEKKVFTKKQQGVKMNMSSLTRVFIEKFNEDPEKMLEFLNII